MIRGIVLIVIDCLRADHVSCYGYDGPTTPTLDALAKHGTLWERAHSLSSWTKPSVTSLLTGLFPTEHGAFLGIKRSKGRSSVMTDVLTSSQPTLAEALSSHGWRCGAFINNAQLGEFTRLDRGFSAYSPRAGKADQLLQTFQDWLETDADTPTFSYLHFLEAHWPYKPRRRHVAMFGGNRDTNYFRDYTARDFGRLRRAVKRGERSLPPEQLAQMIQMYDGAIRRLDGKVRSVLTLLSARGLREETAVFITADHGEEFLEHGQIGHGQSLYDELTHVPLVASVPGELQGRRISQPVSQVNLPHTMARLAGVEDFPGRSLLDDVNTEDSVFSELLVGQRYWQTLRVGDWKLHRRYKFESENSSADQSGTIRERLATCAHTTTLELYDLRQDPREQENLATKEQLRDVIDEMISTLDGWWARITPTADSAGDETEIDERVVRRLRDLGYLE